ncbi:MAG: M24 family metallopeptidase [Rhodospirillaceae bacterium]|nr:M24 family metallopeptidase [Rhodospirillaceae bacterium]
MTRPEIDRRTALGGVAAAMTAVTVPAAAKAADKPEGYAVPKPEIDGKALVNRPRANEVLERFGLAGMIALSTINVYYLTNVRTIGSKFINEYPGFATYAADPQAPIYLVSTSSPAWDIANGDRETAELMPYGFGAGEIERDDNGLPTEPNNGVTRRYHVRDGVELTPREKRWAVAQEKSSDIAANAAWGLARALKAQGITKGKVAVDDMRIAAILAQTDLVDVECVPGYGIFQLIRMVKTEQELAYQRIGSNNNGDACLATIRAIEAGMTHDDVAQIFRFECGKRGNDVDSFIAGFPGGNFPDGVMVAGKPFLVDAVSNFKGYMGDIARTFILGDPSKEVEMRRRANQLAREAVFDAIKPGVKYSTLRKIGLETMIKSGMPDYAVFVTPHSVGLQHDDNPFHLKEFGIDSFDHVLEENMVLTVDLPYLEVGYGCGHNEDLFRVTKTGYEPMNTEEEPFIIL